MMKFHPLSFGIISAVLFGIGTPLSKVLLGDVQPVQLAGILYLGGGSSLLLYRILRSGKERIIQPLSRKESLSLAGSIILGGILAPVSLLIGLSMRSAAESSLLLNFEASATVLIAGMVFKEYIGRRVAWMTAIITLGIIILSFDPTQRFLLSPGSIMIVLATILWGLDNNLARNVSGADPTFIVMVKGLCAGTFSFALSLVLGNDIPPVGSIAFGAAVGIVSYGFSLLFFMLSLRESGSARTGAMFATAPFAGAFASIIIFQNVPSWQFMLALPLMIIGLILLFKESHSHLHGHESIEHVHYHGHTDPHHKHGHGPGRHSHPHVHTKVVHDHPHMPDIHHRHLHNKIK